MATKTISITEEAYGRLKSLKEENESFSEVINKVTGQKSLSKLAGILSGESARKLEKSIAEGRKRSRERRERMAVDI